MLTYLIYNRILNRRKMTRTLYDRAPLVTSLFRHTLMYAPCVMMDAKKSWSIRVALHTGHADRAGLKTSLSLFCVLRGLGPAGRHVKKKMEVTQNLHTHAACTCNTSVSSRRLTVLNLGNQCAYQITQDSESVARSSDTGNPIFLICDSI